MAPVQLSTGPAPLFLTLGQISLGLEPNLVSAAPYIPPTNKEMDILFQPMFDEYLEPPRIDRPVSPTPVVPVPVNSAGTPSSTSIDQDAPSLSHSPSSSASFGDASSAESTYVTQTLHHLGKYSKNHPIDNVIGNPSRPVSTRKQVATDALWCLYNSVLSKVKPKNFKSTITEDCWFQAMQDKIHEFDLLQMTTSVENNSVFRIFFEKQKLTGPNFIDWYRQLRLVRSTEDKENYLEHRIPAALVALPGQQVPPEALAAHAA
nr:zinc finger, CCHC-type [Tanacetum cinerariifolium]